tara:strand:- start:869 stop:1489 length:621 start_codon:yes stop_codon:yes gene_type:complete
MIKQKNSSLNCKNFYINYNNALSKILKDKHFKELEKITIFLEKNIFGNKKIFVCGNGGSASVANHFLCDFNKGIKETTGKKLIPKVVSLTNSVELITAIANDLDYSKIFEYQLENLSNKGDILLIISCSGKSKNIINAAKYAKKNKLNIISLIGFGKNSFLINSSKFYINLQTNNYGLTEDIFQSIMHMLSQYLRIKYSNKKVKIL